MNLTLPSIIPMPYKILAGVALVASLLGYTYHKGYASGHNKAETELAQFAAKVSAKDVLIDKQQGKINELLIVSTLTKIDTIKLRTVKNVESIKEIPGPIVTVHDTVTRVELPLGWVYTHNASAGNYNADSASVTDGTASGLTPNDALRFVVQNYGTCQETALRLNALQTWLIKTQVNVDSSGKHTP